MVRFETQIQKFDKKGEKTGWTYVDISSEVANTLRPGQRTSFLIRGTLDHLAVSGLSLLPMGEGNFILPLKRELLRSLRKKEGDRLILHIEFDPEVYQMNSDLMDCLSSDKEALRQFETMPGSHQKYFSKYVDSAKGEQTRAKRIAMILDAMHLKLNYAEMLHRERDRRKEY
ncbi:MAG TPA: YdeI/OmpD-associated family protein [Chitinophagaceae bacterium]|nr:YdeI/OmpD-associated family protein [Chitinophagaceae bacterium]